MRMLKREDGPLSADRGNWVSLAFHVSSRKTFRADVKSGLVSETTQTSVSGAGEAPGFQLDEGLKFQGRSSSMRLFGWPAAIFSSVSLSQA